MSRPSPSPCYLRAGRNDAVESACRRNGAPVGYSESSETVMQAKLVTLALTRSAPLFPEDSDTSTASDSGSYQIGTEVLPVPSEKTG